MDQASKSLIIPNPGNSSTKAMLTLLSLFSFGFSSCPLRGNIGIDLVTKVMFYFLVFRSL